MDPQLTDDGKPYGPHRFKEIVRERYLISRESNTSYTDLGQITPAERGYLIEFIADDINAKNNANKKIAESMKK